ncbi:hypothetical protein AA313_de0203000 [Arthrobotrys entomopaga]|nr:hypothetical protein AA313_de0203000 [Arthrobotrys entomopaga]
MSTGGVVSYYHLLGVEHDADEATISRSFRRMSRECHPDKHMRDSEEEKLRWNEKMQNLIKAVECLRDPGRRKTYDTRCASMIFSDENDPGNFFRREAEARRAERIAEQERARNEERRRNAARQRESQERARREAEARQRREREEREERARAQREQERRERDRRMRERAREREHAERERVRREQGRRVDQQPFSDSSVEDWQRFFIVLQFIWRLQNIASERQSTPPTPSNSSTPSTPSSPSSSSTPSTPSTPNTEFASSASSNASTPSSNPFTSSNSSFFGASTANTTPQSSPPPPPRFFNWGFTPNSQRASTNRDSYQYPSNLGSVPAISSRRRWSSEEFSALLKLREDYPFERWDSIASKLNYRFGNGRNGNAARLKHRTAFC